MSRSQSSKPESTNYSELQRRLKLQIMQLEAIFFDTYIKGRNDGFKLAISNYSLGQVQHGGGSEQISFIFGEPPQQESSVPPDRKDPER